MRAFQAGWSEGKSVTRKLQEQGLGYLFIPIGGCGCKPLGLGEQSVVSHPSHPIPHAGNEIGSVPSLRDCPGMVSRGGGKIWGRLVGTGVVMVG